MLAGSCLVTSTPEFEDPAQTPPFLLADTAIPDPRQILLIENTQSGQIFSAVVRSEDVGEDVQVRLLLDYGWKNVQLGLPYQDLQQGNRVPASTWDQDGRVARVNADFLQSLRMEPGCHRITLMVSHAFDDATGCPVPEVDAEGNRTVDDFSQITWTVVKCGPAGCPTIDPTDTQKVDSFDPSCPPVEVSCRTEGLGTEGDP
jgi:hypothetical protein